MSKKNSIVLNLKNCFSTSEQILDIYSKFKKKLVNLKTSKFLVAVSGGPDSLALAAMCKVISLNDKKKKFYYVNVNHGIRKNSYKESEFVKKILKKQNISLKIISNKKKITKNIQHNARKVRYSLLNKECKKKNIKLILTAHHKDDQIETFLIRLSRGSGIQGLSSMSLTSLIDNKTKLMRPFLSESKAELIFASKNLVIMLKIQVIKIKNLRSKIRKLTHLEEVRNKRWSNN